MYLSLLRRMLSGTHTLHAVALPGLFRFHHDAFSWNQNIFNIYKMYFKQPGPLEHQGVHGHLMRLASLRRMFVAI